MKFSKIKLVQKVLREILEIKEEKIEKWEY